MATTFAPYHCSSARPYSRRSSPRPRLFSESLEVDARQMYKHACKTGLEGVVSKVRDSRYNSGRTNEWVNKTCAQRETLAIAGIALDDKKFDGSKPGTHEASGPPYA